MQLDICYITKDKLQDHIDTVTPISCGWLNLMAVARNQKANNAPIT